MEDRTPNHYKSENYKCRPVMEDLGLDKDFYLGNAFKYLWRCGTHEDGITSNVQKARDYLEFWLERNNRT